MTDPYKRFETELTRLTREAVMASPALREQYRCHHPRRPWRTIVNSLWIAALIPTALVIMPLSIFSPAVGLLAPDFLDTPQTVTHVDTDSVLAAQSLIIAAGACLVFLIRPGELFCSPGDLTLPAFYPVSERLLLQQAVKGALACLAYFAYTLVLLYGVIAWRDGLTWVQITGMGAIAALQIWHLLSLSIIVAHRIPTRPWVMAAGLVFAAIFFFASFYPALLITAAPQHQHSAALVVMLTPTGWINGALYYGVIQRSAAGWLFLAPLAITSPYAVWWLRRGYAIREFHVSSQGELTPVFEFGLPNPRPEEVAEHSRHPVAENAPPESEQAIEKRLLQSPALAPPDWRKRWFIERWIGALLTPRERTLLEQFYSGPPRWTAAWLLFILPCVLLVVAALAAQRRDWTEEFQPSFAMFLLPFLGVGIELALFHLSRNNELRSTPPLYPIFPVGLDETLAALKKSLALRAIFYVPPVFAAAFAEMRGRPNAWLHASIVTGFLSLIFVAWYLIAARASFSALNRLRYHWRRWTAVAAIGLAGFLNVPLLLVVHQIVSPVLGLLALLLVYVGCRQFDRIYLDTEFDFEMPNPMAPIRPNPPRARGR